VPTILENKWSPAPYQCLMGTDSIKSMGNTYYCVGDSILYRW